jgi:hypothetical protein
LTDNVNKTARCRRNLCPAVPYGLEATLLDFETGIADPAGKFIDKRFALLHNAVNQDALLHRGAR